jgi:hypothetical protein
MGRRPTHSLCVKRKGDKQGRRVGAGWMNEKGWISIKLDPCTCITDRDDVYINLFPNNYDQAREEPSDGDFDPGEPPEYMDDGSPLPENLDE